MENSKESKKLKFNVLSKEEFEERIVPVFDELEKNLVKSFGKYGSNTFIGSGVHAMSTKDGYTIAKYLEPEDPVDRMISNIAKEPCDRLNATVGDGTTTAIVATNSIYKSYIKLRDTINKMHFVPRDINEVFLSLRDKIIDGIMKNAVKIDVDDAVALKKAIYDVLYISTNGNDEISTMISDLYGEIKYPAIHIEKSTDGTNHSKVIDGFNIETVLTDRVYINTDTDVSKLKECDVLIFDTKITLDIYQNLLKPINELSRVRRRHLIVIAPYYDEVAITGLIRNELMAEYRQFDDINMVLCNISGRNETDKKRMSDLAMLLNTSIINETIMSLDFKSIDEAVSKFDMDNRNIAGIVIYDKDSNRLIVDDGEGNHTSEALISVGYCDEVEIGMKNAIFRGLYYDKDLYNKHIKEAKDDLEYIRHKFESMGIFNTEVGYKQQRLAALGLKTGIIYVGGSSTLMQGFLYDAVDDGVRAAESAYRYGIIQGCNLTTLRVLNVLHADIIGHYGVDSIQDLVFQIIFNGFKDVYKAVLGNFIKNFDIHDDYKDNINEVIIEKLREAVKYEINLDENILTSITDRLKPETFLDYIVEYSIYMGKVFDLNKKEFNNEVINSAQTDIEVLKAVCDLMSLLISGNQLVISR